MFCNNSKLMECFCLSIFFGSFLRKGLLGNRLAFFSSSICVLVHRKSGRGSFVQLLGVQGFRLEESGT